MAEKETHYSKYLSEKNITNYHDIIRSQQKEIYKLKNMISVLNSQNDSLNRSLSELKFRYSNLVNPESSNDLITFLGGKKRKTKKKKKI